jgi:hypothetical protein
MFRFAGDREPCGFLPCAVSTRISVIARERLSVRYKEI